MEFISLIKDLGNQSGYLNIIKVAFLTFHFLAMLITIPYIGILIYLLYVIYGIGIIIYTPLLNKKAKSSANTDNVSTKSKKIEVNKSEEKIAENKTENVTKDESPTVDSKNSEVEKNTTENKEEKSEE